MADIYWSDHDCNKKSINLIQKLASNGHFNLVVVYTSDDSENVAADISLALSRRTTEFQDDEDILSQIENWEDDDRNIRGKLLGSIDKYDFVNILQDPLRFLLEHETHHYFQDFKNLVSEKPGNVNLDVKKLLGWVLAQKQDKLVKNNVDFGEIFTKVGHAVNWIKSDRLFVTVIKKEADNASSIPDLLLDALNDWKPTPHRLLLAKMRAELDKNGVPLEELALKNHYIQAGWIEDFIDSKKNDLRWTVNSTTSKLWQSIAESMANGINIFAEELKEQLGDDARTVIKTYCSIDINDNTVKLDVCKHINQYVCNEKTATGSYLVTGQIFEWTENGAEEKEYYLCLTPACDLVPRYGKPKGWNERLGDKLPVKILKLHPAETCFRGTPEKALKHLLSNMNSNLHLLLNVDNSIEGFSSLPSSNANPMWEQVFADNNGTICWEDGVPTVNLSRVSTNADVLKFSNQSCRIVAQLRYEYALNFLQKLGVSLTRVGLDYKQLSS